LDFALNSAFNVSAKYLCKLQGVPIEPLSRNGAPLTEPQRTALDVWFAWAKEQGIFV
jgi:hypothetical protein